MAPNLNIASHHSSSGNATPVAKPRVALSNMTNISKSQQDRADDNVNMKDTARASKADAIKLSQSVTVAPKVGSKLAVENTTAAADEDSPAKGKEADSAAQQSILSADESPRADGDEARNNGDSAPLSSHQGDATTARINDNDKPKADTRSNQFWNEQQGFDPQLLEGAIKAVLTERFGVSNLNQLPVADAESLLSGPLPQMVVQHMQRNASAQGGKASMPTTPQRSNALGLSFADGNSPASPTTPGSKTTPFPADALPSEIQLEQNTNLYLNGLEEHITDDELLRIGSQYGEIISHKAIINSETGLCKGYGFIMYARARDAAVAIVELQKKGFQTSFARHESFSAKLRMMSDSRSTNVYISNLPLAMGEEELEALVRPHQIISRRILTKPDGTSRGVGFIRFQSRDIAQSCIDLLHGRRLDGHPHPLQARFADSESQKRLKQDTTLRKIYADLDMGVLRSPSGHNLRPTPLSNNNVWASGANYGAGRYGVVPHGAQVASSAMQAMTGAIPMRFTNSEPGMPRHAGQRIANEHQHLHQQIHHNQQQQQHQQLMRAAGQYSAAVPMSATTSNASFYPGAPFTGTPPTSMSPWVAASGGGVIATTDTDIGVASGLWTQPGSPVQPIFNAQTAANMGPNGWLLPSSTAATAVGIKSAPQVDKTKAVNNRLWSPLLSTDGNLAPASPSIDGSTVGTNTTFNSPVFPANEGSFASMAKPAQWVAPTFNAVPRIRMADGTESSALEQKHLGSLLTSGINGGSGGLGDGAATSGTGNGNANQQDWLQHYALNGDAAVMMYPPELNFVRASGQTSAVPIINPQTGQRFQGESSTGNEADDAMSEAHASSGSHEQQQRGMQEMGTSKSTPNALSDMAATPTMASSVSAPTGLNQQQGH